MRAFDLGLLDPAPLITHEFPPERFAEAVAPADGGDPKTGKAQSRPRPGAPEAGAQSRP
ncbi:hypothetical protein OG462_03715 [Streptomyces sp. NBC_01077]|uniref:hypothetical protein n=1 Tax=Streptomyces sp. NBC_01077 TaxID=2903746 RepID=UPI00386CC47A|nr:hypothetical protein OG462_03715 [Streptomyces sp. NBC_01077]